MRPTRVPAVFAALALLLTLPAIRARTKRDRRSRQRHVRRRPAGCHHRDCQRGPDRENPLRGDRRRRSVQDHRFASGRLCHDVLAGGISIRAAGGPGASRELHLDRERRAACWIASGDGDRLRTVADCRRPEHGEIAVAAAAGARRRSNGTHAAVVRRNRPGHRHERAGCRRLAFDAADDDVLARDAERAGGCAVGRNRVERDRNRRRRAVLHQYRHQ